MVEAAVDGDSQDGAVVVPPPCVVACDGDVPETP